MHKKNEAEKHLELYLGEIKNKLGIIPAFFHSDRGGEFNSKLFINKLKSQGICTEQGPQNSPETNGIAERFNQSLLTKVCFLFSQSNIPISYWGEAVNHASLLLNHLPHKYVNMKSAIEILSINGIKINLTIRLERIIPFGMKVIVKSIANTKQEQIKPIPASTNQELVTNKNYQYVPYYKEPERHISSSVSTDNIIEGKQIRKNPDRLFLTDLVPYTQAIKDPIEKDLWKEEMYQEFNSLMSHNTRILVPQPKNGEKVIGGMWCLNKKRNEFCELYRYNARWVIFGNHQEHMVISRKKLNLQSHVIPGNKSEHACISI
ncbi:hypothetical protein O181_106320 [Austropuccinia psidii MF-1]|uniref:Integrase catalytic domain-containing protein n=1 Tax=Austropuccinia psidii MF-1 TaxID=1389203 RepID=A0A9Q3JSA1_9BASI|nr:hypothetical protein [Austropuccinia psidii MF-1]